MWPWAGCLHLLDKGLLEASFLTSLRTKGTWRGFKAVARGALHSQGRPPLQSGSRPVPVLTRLTRGISSNSRQATSRDMAPCLPQESVALNFTAGFESVPFTNLQGHQSESGKVRQEAGLVGSPRAGMPPASSGSEPASL